MPSLGQDSMGEEIVDLPVEEVSYPIKQYDGGDETVMAKFGEYILVGVILAILIGLGWWFFACRKKSDEPKEAEYEPGEVSV